MTILNKLLKCFKEEEMKIGNSKYELNNIYNCDCLEAMKQIPDKYFELAIDILTYL